MANARQIFRGRKSLYRKVRSGARRGRRAIHGGAVPIRVRNVEGVVACVVVSGLKQDEDHGVVMEALQEYLCSLR